jgi:hypothetical protein
MCGKGKKQEIPVRRKLQDQFQTTRRMYLKSDVTIAISWDISPISIRQGKGKENIIHMQQIWKSPHLKRRRKNQKMKNLSLSQLSQVLSLKEIIFG